MSDYAQELERHVARVLVPGERPLASVRAMPVGPFGGSMGIFAGAVEGAVVQAVAISRSVKRARLSRFPIAGRMAVAITDRRILVWQRGGVLGTTITKLIGEVPLTRIDRIEVERVPGRSKLTFVFRDAQKVTVEADKRDSPERFAELFHRFVAGGVPASAAPAPPQVVVSATAPPVAVPAAVPAAAPSFATTLAEDEGKPCPTRQTRNPSSAAYCRRCSAPFASLSQPFPQRPGPAGALGGAQAPEAPPPPAGSWTLPQPPPFWLPAPASHQAEGQILDGARRYGVTAKAGFYGIGGLPSFAVVTYDYHPGPADTPQSIMQGLASGVSGSGTGSSVDLSTVATDSAGGVTYQCASPGTGARRHLHVGGNRPPRSGPGIEPGNPTGAAPHRHGAKRSR